MNLFGYGILVEDCWEGVLHWLIGLMPFEETKSKAMRAYAQSRQYHVIVENRDS